MRESVFQLNHTQLQRLSSFYPIQIQSYSFQMDQEYAFMYILTMLYLLKLIRVPIKQKLGYYNLDDILVVWSA